jgi:acetate kinase
VRILVVNAGSSSLKLRVIDERDALVASADLPASPTEADLGAAIAKLGPIDAAGHRIVHGGIGVRDAILVDDGVVARIEALTDLAPLHQPASLAALRGTMAALAHVPHVACFDTAFHADLPAAAATYALPAAWRERWGIRRFGFHGLSHAYASRHAAELLGRAPETVQLITCHLGAGASLAAIRSGRSVDTTMGFTPLEGLVMATRSGSIDPGIVLWLQERAGLGLREVADGLERHAGLVGLAGTADMREVLAGAAAGRPDAVLARDVYVHRLAAGIAAMRPALDRLDALVFTGGVGENSAEIRRLTVDRLRHLGLRLDAAANEAGEGDRDIGPAGDPASRVLVVSSREDLEIARQARQVLGAAATG